MFGQNSYSNNLFLALKTNKFVFTTSILFSNACLIFLILTNFDKKAFAALPLIPLFFILHYNTSFAISFAIMLLFTRFSIAQHTIVGLFSIPLLYSFLISYRSSNTESRVSIPLFLPFLFYLFSIMPSFINTSSLLMSLNFSSNLLAIAIYFFVIGKYVNSYKQISFFTSLFMTCIFVNSISVVINAWQGAYRSFGFMGVVYVDFVCVALLILLTVALYKRSSNPWLYLFASFILFITLLLTKTRNTTLSLLFTLFTGIAYIFFNTDTFKLRTKTIIRNSLLTLGITLIIFLIFSNSSHGALNRFNELLTKQEISVQNEEDFGKSSLVSRLLIWHTAINAFVQHPIIGIGAYSFSFDSKRYHTIPNMLYSLFVEKLSPHITYLSVLTETGILGFTGFLIFLFSTLAMGYKSLRNSKNDQQRFFSLGIFLIQVYIASSMAMSDAWLWDQCAMLWGIVLGISVANYNLVKNTTNND